MTKCTTCGEELEYNAKFCTTCGAKIGNVKNSANNYQEIFFTLKKIVLYILAAVITIIIMAFIKTPIMVAMGIHDYGTSALDKIPLLLIVGIWLIISGILLKDKKKRVWGYWITAITVIFNVLLILYMQYYYNVSEKNKVSNTHPINKAVAGVMKETISEETGGDTDGYIKKTIGYATESDCIDYIVNHASNMDDEYKQIEFACFLKYNEVLLHPKVIEARK